MTGVNQEMSQMRAEYEARQEGVEQGSNRAMKELREMLSAQQRMSAK